MDDEKRVKSQGLDILKNDLSPVFSNAKNLDSVSSGKSLPKKFSLRPQWSVQELESQVTTVSTCFWKTELEIRNNNASR